jgi:hypothetical protein
MKRSVVFALISFALPANAAGNEPPGLRQAVNQIMVHDQRSDQRDEEFLSKFTPRFRAAIVKDMSGPDIGLISYGILCHCQHGVSKMQILSISGAKDTATVKVETWASPDPPVTQTWHMQRVGRSWQISDLETPDGRSLLRELER